jgi:O-antigen/teichoic acid export membrane protein
MPEPSLAGRRPLLARLLANPLLQRVVRNSGYLFSASTISAALSMGQSALAARLLGVAGFGLLGTVTVFASVVNGLTSSRMGQLVVSYVSHFTARKEDQKAAAVFKAAALAEMASSLLAYALVLALAPLAARIFAPRDPANAGLYSLYGLIILANLIAESSTGLLQVFNRFRVLAAVMVGQSALTLVLMVGAVLVHGGIVEVLIVYLAGKVVWALSITSVALWQARLHWGVDWWRASLGLLADRAKELVLFALNTNLTTTLNLVTRDSELLWLSAFSTQVQVGYYKVALAIRNILIMPVEPLITTTYRETAHEVAGKRWQNVRYLLRSGSLLSAMWTVPAGVGLALLGKWLISLLWGPAFQPAHTSLMILLIGVVAVNIFFWNRNVLLPLGMPEYPTKVHLVAAIVKVAGIVLLVPAWGANGMAMLLSAFYVGTTGALVWKTYREVRRAERLTAPAAEVGG